MLDAENSEPELPLKLLEAEAKAARTKWNLCRVIGVASSTPPAKRQSQSVTPNEN